jgi:hypothetical protein
MATMNRTSASFKLVKRGNTGAGSLPSAPKVGSKKYLEMKKKKQVGGGRPGSAARRK